MDTHLVAVAGDIHMTNHHPGAWASFKSWVKENSPKLLVLNGDIVDLEALSFYDMESDAEVHAIKQIQFALKEINELAGYVERVIIMPGNHEARWAKAVFGAKAAMLKGAKGLTLREQFYAQGLNPEVRWVSESSSNPGVWVGRRALLVRHGHRQASRFGGTDIAGRLLREAPAINQIVGHHHRAQVRGQTVLDKTYTAIANPHLSGSHEYRLTPDWQRGFTILEFYGRSRLRDCEKFTSQVVIMDGEGHFAYQGKVY